MFVKMLTLVHFDTHMVVLAHFEKEMEVEG